MAGKISNPYDEVQAKEKIESILINKIIRDVGLSILSAAIVEANNHRRDNWAVTNTENYPDAIWLQVGHYATVTLENNIIWLALDKQLIETPLDGGISFIGKNEWGWKPQVGGLDHFKDRHKPGIPISINGYYSPVSHEAHLEIWFHIRRLLFEFIYKAQYAGQPMGIDTKKLHLPCILMYLRNATGMNIPDPL